MHNMSCLSSVTLIVILNLVACSDGNDRSPLKEAAPAVNTATSTVDDEITALKSSTMPNPQRPVGSDKDKYGCIGSAGYQWCAKLAQCLRPWEVTKKHGKENTPAAFEQLCWQNQPKNSVN